MMDKLGYTSKYSMDNKNEAIKELEFRLSNLKSDFDDEKELQEEVKQKMIEEISEKNMHI